jgi:hypothetical protein
MPMHRLSFFLSILSLLTTLTTANLWDNIWSNNIVDRIVFPRQFEFKISWKDVEAAVRKDFPRLKIVYSRADPHEGDLALSSHRLNNVELDKLTSTTLKI